MTLLLPLFFFLVPVRLASADLCPASRCSNDTTQVRFPFRLQGRQPETCRFPGFNLTCNDQNLAVLNLPYSGEFLVRHINYLTQKIYLYDSQKCIAKRLLSLNLSGSPFEAVFRQNYTFVSCPTQMATSRFATIDCLSNSTSSVFATSAVDVVASLPSSCRVVAALPVPVSWPDLFDQGFPTDLREDIELTWYQPNCVDCEARGGICGLKSNTSLEIVCFDDPSSGSTSNGLKVFRIICLTVAVPAFACAAAISAYACCKDCCSPLRPSPAHRSTATSVVAPQPEVVGTGLDESTIESYQKLVLGESRRLPGPNDTSCTICLAEYLSKETVRCIPECSHCFHADCIDEWLRMKGTCPVCRNSPSPPRVYSRDEHV